MKFRVENSTLPYFIQTAGATYDESTSARFQQTLSCRVELWAKSIKDFGNFGLHFSCATSPKILAACRRVCQR